MLLSFALSCVCVNKTWIQVFLVTGFVCFICVYVYVYVRQMYTGGSHHQRILNTTIFIHIYIYCGFSLKILFCVCVCFDFFKWLLLLYKNLRQKEHPPMSRVSQKRYPHPSCFISDRSKFGIITSRLHCFNRICQRRGDFVDRCRIFFREFLSRGYTKTRVRAFAMRFFKSVPTTFPLPNSLKHFVGSLFPI